MGEGGWEGGEERSPNRFAHDRRRHLVVSLPLILVGGRWFNYSVYLSPRSGSRAPTPSSGFSHRSFFSLARAMASIQETESDASDKFLRLQALVQRWNAMASGAAEPSSASSREPPLVAPRPEEEPRHLPEEAPAADSEAPTTQEDPPTPSPEKEAPPWWADPAECPCHWWSQAYTNEAYTNFVPTQTQPGEQATSAPASSLRPTSASDNGRASLVTRR